jgi:opacity protein-like surface antigen
LGARAWKAVAPVGLTVAALITCSSAALAQANCTSTQNGPVLNLSQLAVPSSGVAGSLAGAIGNINTIFLTQQGSAFVSAPPNPAPDQPGGGVWARAVGGEATIKSTSNSNGTFLVPTNPGQNTTISTNCANNQRNDFAGIQVGQDISRLNWGGWNVHLGTTAGYVSSKANDNLAGFTTNFEVPFIGTYAVATHGRFFADILLREEFYNIRLNDPALGFNNQGTAARGTSVAVSAGYNFDVGHNWFIEPSAGFVYSKTRVDSFTSPGSVTLPITGLNTFNDIDSEIGRLSVRAGTTIASGNMIWQPFGSISVFHEFAGNVNSSFTSLNAVQNPGANPATYVQTTSTSRVGTYGQYSLGIAAQVANTGWLGFARVDYRNGDNIEGWTGNAGIRYQFTPEMIAAVMPTKIPVKARPFVAPTNWTGFYVGGFFGADIGQTDVRFVGSPFNDGNNVRTAGAIGGGQAGYNYQVNKWVFGVEGDIGAANVKGSRTCGTSVGLDGGRNIIAGPAGFSSVLLDCTDRMDWVATATARVGYAWDRTLFYVKGGGAWTDDRMTANCIVNAAANVAPNNPRCIDQTGATTNGFNVSSSRAGWTIGYGTEFDLGHNWSAKAEYDYIDFGRRSTLASDGTTTISDHPTTSQVKIGVNYRFAPTALVAKY